MRSLATLCCGAPSRCDIRDIFGIRLAWHARGGGRRRLFGGMSSVRWRRKWWRRF